MTHENAALRVGIAADHGGFELKGEITESLRRLGYDVLDFGARELNSDDDYPDYSIPLARQSRLEGSTGVALCGRGVGAPLPRAKFRVSARD
jgi:ribose 5-phosphate isomerase B